MSKVTYIIKASNDVLNEKTAAILITIAKKDFITAAEVREVHPDLGNAVVTAAFPPHSFLLLCTA